MAVRLGVHAERLTAVRALLTTKGRRQTGRFAFEGPTLLAEAHESGTHIKEVYATQDAYDAQPLVRQLDESGVPTFIVHLRSATKISDLESPSGIVGIASLALADLSQLFSSDGIVLALADLNDPGNVGTLVRSAWAFGARGVVAGRLGADPYHPKAVRAAMGALFRVPVALADPEELAQAAQAGGYALVGLAADGSALSRWNRPSRCAVVVGHERGGLGRWEALCRQRVAIPMEPGAESLNAAVAGSIVLYEARMRPALDPS